MDDKRELYAADLTTATWREALRFTAAEWAAFLSGVHDGEFG
jgi:hypothetical protein